MKTPADKTQENKSKAAANDAAQKQNSSKPAFRFVDNRPSAIANRKLQETINNSPQAKQLKAIQEMADNSPRAKQLKAIQKMADNSPRIQKGLQLQAMMQAHTMQKYAQFMKEEEEEEPLQGKFETTQRSTPDEADEEDEEETLQGKFKPGGQPPNPNKQIPGTGNQQLTTQQKAKSNEDDETLQGKFETTQKQAETPVKNNTGLPDNLKTGIENLSGHSMDDVNVHYNSGKPKQLQAHAYAQGTDIHLGPGQEKHLPHEAWHVVQQKQGRVKPTTQLKGNVNINDDAGLENEADEMGAKANRNLLQRQIAPFPFQTKKRSPRHWSGSGMETRTAQRQVIQLEYDADAKLEEAKTKKDQAIEKINADDYDKALELHAEVKEIARDLNERKALSSVRDKVYNRHSNGSVDHLKAIIKAFQEIPQPKVDALTEKFENLSLEYEAEYNTVFDQIANAIANKEDLEESNQKITSAGEQHLEKYKALEKEFGPVFELNKKLKKDKDLQYSLGQDRMSTISDSALKALDLSKIEEPYKKNRKLYNRFEKKKKTKKKYEDDTENEPLRKDTALILLAGSEERKTKIVELFEDDFLKQLSVFNQINKKHRSAPIEDVVALINDAGTENLEHTLQLIDKVGGKGSIAEINLYQKKIRDTKDKPNLEGAVGFPEGLEYESLSKLTEFVTEVGKVCGLASLKELWEKAVENDNIDSTISFFEGAHIPEALAGSEAEIGLAFAQKTGESTAEDWGKLLNISEWEKENLVALATAFDKNSGNATAEQWVTTAKADPDLKTKPDEVRATARLNMFANEEWYDNYDISTKGSSAKKAQKKYTQLLYALMGDKDLTGLGNISFDNIKGDFLSMLVFFHRHIASFDSDTGQGFDREKTGEGKYSRSNKDHPLNEQYTELLSGEGINTRDLLQPLNSALLGLQGGGRITSTGTKGGATYRKGSMGVASAGLPSHNLKILEDQQEIIGVSGNEKKAKETFFKDPKLGSAPKTSRSVDDDASITDKLLEKQEEGLKGKVGGKFANKNFHDGLLQDRGALVKKISTVINSISGGNQVLNAIGSEGHPSLILKVPKPAKYKYKNKDYNTTKQIVPDIATDFNSASGQEIKITERGSFGFQRPTVADTGESVRLWPGYAPVESLLPGLKAVVQNLNSKKIGTPLTNIDDLDSLETDTSEPVLYIEALKTAMRHAFIVLKEKIDSSAPDEKKRVYEWLKSRMLIKLQQAGILLEKGNALYDGISTLTQKEKNKHYAMTADMTDKLQEYSMLLSATTLGDTANPNSSHTTPGKFKDTDDAYEKKVVSKLSATDYRIFYLDSGEQALVSAGILANRFQKGKDESDSNVRKSKYISRNPYFEIGVFGGDRRSNLEKDDSSGTIVHADLSPVITEGRTTPKPKSETQTEVKRTWQNESGDVTKSTMIPIIDITNSSIDEVTNLGKMPDNFIVVESLTKHEQLGADKFIMGRLIAVSNTEGTKGPNTLVKTNFLDLAQKIVGPVANEAYNPLLSKIRTNMDKALYSDDLA